MKELATKEIPSHVVDGIHTAASQFPTPFHLYDAGGIRRTAREIQGSFPWVSSATGRSGGLGYTNYFAVKALPNPHILLLLKEEGMGVDCSSLPELVLAQRVGFKSSDIIFTSNNTPLEEYRVAKEMGALINIDDISHVAQIHAQLGMPQSISFRYNPGPARQGNAIIGNPKEAKFGLTKDQILQAYPYAQSLGCTTFGLHTMIISNELNPQYFIDTATMLFELALEIFTKTGISIDTINLGGGIGIPYTPSEQAVSFKEVSAGIHQQYTRIIEKSPLHPIRIVSEHGRCVTGPSGYLVCRVRHIKESYKTYVGVDANMSDLMRPGMYGAYHHITPLDNSNAPTKYYDITGSLCENNDKFAIDRHLPPLTKGDILVIHDTGAHGYAMGFNYNGKLKHAELLLEPSGEVRTIRNAETIENYFLTLDF